MEVLQSEDREEIKITRFPYKGKNYDVKGVRVRWLSKTGEDDSGQPEYGLRLFTVEPDGEIPTHNHFYVQTMYILSGRFNCWSSDPASGEVIQEKACGPGSTIYIPSMEPHGMRNESAREPGSFLCCICNVYPDDII